MYRKIVIICVALFCSVYSVFADHYAGAELTYECIGTNAGGDSSLYNIKLFVYRDCGGVDYSPVYDILYQSVSCGVPQTPLRLIGETVEEITNLCPGDESQCTDFNSTIHGLERRVYSRQIMLPRCTDWYFFWKNQNRNSAGLSNISAVGPLLFQPIFVYMKFNNIVAPCENFFGFEPGNLMDQNICVGDTFEYDFYGAMSNSDGDSAYFTLVPPLTNTTGTSVIYETGFDYLNPIASTNGFVLNGASGVLTFAPTYLASSIFAVKVEEFKNGVKVGESVRDMQLITENCDNERPEFTQNSDTFNFCINTYSCRNISSYDVDNPSDFTFEIVNNGLPAGATITPHNDGKGIEICWKPDTSQKGQTFPLTININDHNCPISLEQTKTYYFTVPTDTIFQCVCSGIDLDYDHACIGDTTEFIGLAELTSGDSVVSWQWDFGDGFMGTGMTVDHAYPGPGSYYAELTYIDNTGCEKTHGKTVLVCDTPTLDFTWTDSCEYPKRIEFNDELVGPCPGGKRKWLYGDGSGITASDWHRYKDTGVFTVTLIVEYGDPTTATQCIHTYKKDLYVNPKPDFEIYPDSHYQSCDPSYDTLFYVELGDTSFRLQWGFTEDNFFYSLPTSFPEIPDSLGGKDDTLFINSLDLTDHWYLPRHGLYSATVTDSIGCQNIEMRAILDPIIPQFYRTPYCNPGDTICFVDLTQLDTNNLHYDYVRRLWNFRDAGSTQNFSSDSIGKHVFTSEGDFESSLTIFDSDSCFDELSYPITKIQRPDDYFSIESELGESDSICFYGHILTFEGPNQVSSTIDRYTWYIDDDGIDSIVIINNNLVDPTEPWLYFVNGTEVEYNELDSTVFNGFKTFTHQYDHNNAGNLYIKLKLTYNTERDYDGNLIDSLSCERWYYDTIYLRPSQALDIEPLRECLDDTIILIGTHDPLSDRIVSWKWDYGDDYTSLTLDTVYNAGDSIIEFSSLDSNVQRYEYFQYEYPDIGKRRVLLVVADNKGCETRYAEWINVIRMDTMSIRPAGFCNNDITLFPPASLDRWQNIDLYRWNFGDSSTVSDTAYIVVNDDSTLTYSYLEEGWHTVWLEISGNNHSCIDTLSDSLFIHAAPTAYFTPQDSTCVGDTTILIDESHTNSILNDSIRNWFMVIKSDTYQYQMPNLPPDIIYFFQEAGAHDSILWYVQSTNQCNDLYFGDVWVSHYPDADFTFDPSLPVAGDNINFTDITDWHNETLHADSSHIWTVWDSTFSMLNTDRGGSMYNYNYLFPDESVYYVDLIATNAHYCRDTVRKEMDTYAFLDFPTAFSPDQYGDEENNTFKLYSKGFKSVEEFKIYNRYGEMVFDGNGDLYAEWDGRWRNRPQETGSYIVVVHATDFLNREVRLKKNLLLIR